MKNGHKHTAKFASSGMSIKPKCLFLKKSSPSIMADFLALHLLAACKMREGVRC